jgi:hypothetical protein
MECDTCDVASMTFESKERVWVGGLDIVELDGMVTSGGKKALVGGYAKTVDLRVGVLDCSRTNAGECLPEAERIKRLARLPPAAGERHTGLYGRNQLLPGRRGLRQHLVSFCTPWWQCSMDCGWYTRGFMVGETW